MASSLNNSAWQEWIAGLMGGVSRQNYSATLRPDRFYCRLDDLPSHLVPQTAWAALRNRSERRDLFLNPECQIHASGKLPQELRSQPELGSVFLLEGAIAWVRGSSTGSLIPFWLGPELESVVAELRPGEPIPLSVSALRRSILEGAGILISPDSIAERYRAREEAVQMAAKLFQKKGYAALHGLIHPFHIAALRRYYRYRIRTRAIPLGDGQSPRRYVAYNDPVARFFHRQIAPVVNAVAGEPVKPSYVYLA